MTPLPISIFTLVVAGPLAMSTTLPLMIFLALSFISISMKAGKCGNDRNIYGLYFARYIAILHHEFSDAKGLAAQRTM